MNSSHPAERRAERGLMLAFAVMSLGIVMGGVFYYRHYERQFRDEAELKLAAVANLKVDELVQYRKERLEDANNFYNNSMFSGLVRRFLGQPADADAQRQLQSWLAKFQASYEYARVYLLDVQGAERLAVPDQPEPLPAHLTNDITAVLRSGRVTFLDFHRDVPGLPVQLEILVPIFDGSDTNRPLGVLALRINPETSLYPFIQRWPTPSRTAETLLVRRDGNDVLFLNELKFATNTILNLRIPLANTNAIAVKAVLGQEGIVNGLDYRGEPVIADVRAVPGSPWFLVAREDVAEVFAPLRERLWQMIFTLGVLILASGAVVGLIWRQQRVRYYRERYAAEAERARLGAIVESSEDAIIGKNLDGIITSWNAGAERIYGYSAAEVVGKSITMLIPPGQPDEFPRLAGKIKRGEAVKHYETWRLRKNGERIQVSLSLSPVKDAAGTIVGVSAIGRDITRQKLAEAALKENEERLHLALAGTNQGVYDLNLQTGAAVASPEYARMLGYEPGEMEFNADQWRQMVHPGDLEMAARTLGECAKGTRTEYRMEYRLKTKHGDWRWILSLGKVVEYDAQGRPRRMLGTHTDITERKRTEEIMRARLRLLQFATDHSLDELLQKTLDEVGLLVDSPVGFYHFVGADQKTLSLMAWSTRTVREFCKAEGKGMHYDLDQAGVWADCIRERRALIHNNYAALPRRKGLPPGHTPVVRELVVPIFRKDRVVAVLGVGNKLRDYTEEDVEVVTFMADVAWEIAVHKQAETRLRQLSSAVEHSPASIVITDAAGNIEYVNPKFTAVTGYSSEEVIGKNPRILKSGEMPADGYQRMWQTILSGAEWRGEFHNRKKNGELFWEAASISSITDDSGKIAHFIAVKEDITEQKLAEEKLQHTLADLERSNKELEQFAYVASHDLQEPLRMVSSYTQLLAKRLEGRLDEKTQKYVRYAVDGATRMQSLINDLLAYARVGTRGQPFEPTDSRAALGGAMRNLIATIAESGAIVTNADLPTVRADASQLVLLFQNLIANAIKFRRADTPSIHVSAQDKDREWVFAVKDNGIGIEPRHAERVFMIFQRLHTREEYPGTGIGLAVCKRIVERHGGKIWFESEPGKGTTFFFTIPK
ncbi:MAG: PAS domain S-box protein [Verrucomicrobiota bacterium]